MGNEYPEFLKRYRDALVRQEVAARDKEIHGKPFDGSMDCVHNDCINSTTPAKECPDDRYDGPIPGVPGPRC